MTAIEWHLWRGGRALIHAHAPGNPRSLCGRESVHGTTVIPEPSLQQLIDGDVCHHCHDRMTARAQLARLRGAA